MDGQSFYANGLDHETVATSPSKGINLNILGGQTRRVSQAFDPGRIGSSFERPHGFSRSRRNGRVLFGTGPIFLTTHQDFTNSWTVESLKVVGGQLNPPNGPVRLFFGGFLGGISFWPVSKGHLVLLFFFGEGANPPKTGDPSKMASVPYAPKNGVQPKQHQDASK